MFWSCFPISCIFVTTSSQSTFCFLWRNECRGKSKRTCDLRPCRLRNTRRQLTRNVWISEKFRRRAKLRSSERTPGTKIRDSGLPTALNIKKTVKQPETISVTVFPCCAWCTVTRCTFTCQKHYETGWGGKKKKKERFSQWEFRGSEWDGENSTHGFRLNSTYCSWMDGSITSGCLLAKYNTRIAFPFREGPQIWVKTLQPSQLHSGIIIQKTEGIKD